MASMIKCFALKELRNRKELLAELVRVTLVVLCSLGGMMGGNCWLVLSLEDLAVDKDIQTGTPRCLVLYLGLSVLLIAVLSSRITRKRLKNNVEK